MIAATRALLLVQGLDKVDRRVLYAQEYKAWQGTPAEFLIDGHAPVRGS
jgi:hypothetical protein